jgi:hypothetical protein
MTHGIENINARGARRRRQGGFWSLAIAVVAFVTLVVVGAPRSYRAALAIPIGLAAIGFLQAREKTCIALCAVGQREPTDDRPETTPTPAEQRALRRQSVSIVVWSIVIAALSTAALVRV